jgi:hydrogenase/urease accessory protein HupE
MLVTIALVLLLAGLLVAVLSDPRIGLVLIVVGIVVLLVGFVYPHGLH